MWDFWFSLWEPAIKQTMKVMDEMSIARRRELTREYQEEQEREKREGKGQ